MDGENQRPNSSSYLHHTGPSHGQPHKDLSRVDDDAAMLAETGHVQELPRQFSFISMLALAFTVLGTWSTLAQNLASGLTAGGPVSILWGLVLVTFCNLCIALSLGELLSSMPTALGQAYWIYRLWTTPTGRFVSYMCAWINTFGWWTLTASQVAFMTRFMLAMKVVFDQDWPGAGYGWLQFVVYVALTAFLTTVNIVSTRKDRVLPWINNIVGIQFLLLFVALALALIISVAVKSELHFRSADFVFTTWFNETNWPNGVIWFMGLVQSAYGLTAFDACIHMIEELPSPSRTGPRILWLSVAMGAATGFIFMMVCLFCIQDLEVIKAADLPFVQLCVENIGLVGGSILLALFIVNGVGQNVGIMTTASRLTWGFARDGGLPFNEYIAVVDKAWRVPIRALWVQGAIISLVGVLYFFANTVLQAILSVSTIALTISYAMPIAVLLVVGRDKLPPGSFRLGKWGSAMNVISIIYCTITSIFFLFPEEPDPTPADMNWAVAVFGIMLLFAIAFWFVNGHRSYLKNNNALFRVLDAQVLDTVLSTGHDATHAGCAPK